MPLLSEAKIKGEYMLNYIGSEYVSRVTFSVSEKVVGVVFSNGLKANLHFDKYTSKFDGITLRSANIEDQFSTGIELKNTDEDKAVLVFLYNIMNRKGEGFIFMCEQEIVELWNNN